MNALEITEARAAALNKLEGRSIEILQDYLDGKRAGGDEIVTARGVLNTVKGNRQTVTVHEALRFNMVSSLTDDPKVLAGYVKATQPQIKKLLGNGVVPRQAEKAF